MHLKDNTLLQGGKYRIVRFIGAGGFGCTYEAQHVLMDSRVALKEFFVNDFCNRDDATGQVSIATQSKVELVEKLKKKFIEEARALFQMHHPGIVRVIDIFEENNTAYYVMEYIDGLSLSELLKQRDYLPEAEAVGYIRQVAEALQYVHGLNRLHLDVKPGNIMLNREGKAVLIDFGASKYYDVGTGENTSTLLGINTKGYAPVEQVNMGFTSFSPATDIYALGATLYKLLTGITPPPSTALHAEEATLSPLPPSVSAATREAVAAAMQLLRKNRPQTVEAWMALLPAAGQEEEAVAAKPTEETILPEEVAMPPQPTPNLVKSTRGTMHGHEWVDLGLSVKWATMNVGASSPSDYGDYFAWGETIPKSEYTEANCKTYSNDISNIFQTVFQKWLGDSKISNKDIGDIAGNAAYDAARANWGDPWRLPTKAECEELMNQCTWTWTTQGGHNGYRVTGKNGNSIFLPAAGYRYGTSLDVVGEFGCYWSSAPYGSDTGNAYLLYFYFSRHRVDWYCRSYGRSVRPVSE